MTEKISNHLEIFLKSIGEQAVTEAHLGSDEENKKEEYRLPSKNQIEYAAKILLKSMKAEKYNREILLYLLMAISLVWFLLSSGVIIYMITNNHDILYLGGVLGIDLLGLAVLLPFLHCVYQSKTNIDIFIAIFPSMGAKERIEIARSFFLHLKDSRCDFGRSTKK